MNKNPPSAGRIFAMVAFTLSVFALLMFFWVSFGGTLPLGPKGYRFTATFPEATLLVEEADVRLAGVNVGKVKDKELGPGGQTTVAEIEIDSRFAPIRRDTRAMLRQKSLLGETYVEITPVLPARRRSPTADTCATGRWKGPRSSTRSSASSTSPRDAASRSGCTRRASSAPAATRAT